MLRIILGVFIFIVFCGGAYSHGYCKNEPFKESADTQEEIQIINLLNNLNLKKEQMEFIVEKAKKVKVLKEAGQKEAFYSESVLAEITRSIKEEVEQGKVTVNAADACNFREIKDKIDNIRHNAYVQINNIAIEVENVLEEFQLLALDAYKPCIIPIIQNGRIGQADKALGIGKILERVKKIPELKYAQVKGVLADRVLEKIKLKFPPNMKINEVEIKERVFVVFSQVRAMDEFDFLIQKDSLAQKLHDEILPPKIQASRKDKLVKFLLSEKTIVILDKRISS